MRKFMPFVIGFAIAALISGGFGFFMATRHVPTSGIDFLPGAVVGALVTMLLISRSGNREVAFASREQQDAALAATPQPDGTLIYVYRKSFSGRALGVDIELDGASVAQIRSGRFICLTVSPGSHRLTASFAANAIARATPLFIDIAAIPGEIRAYRIDNVMGLLQNALKAAPIGIAEARSEMTSMRMVVLNRRTE
jgi:hypothetical protein